MLPGSLTMKTVLAALALLSATVVSPLVGQGDEDYTRKTLAGLKVVYVVVEPIKDDAERDGLRGDQVSTDVELTLRQAGITVLGGEQGTFPAGTALLYVNVHAFKSPGMDVYAYSVEVQLHQQVRLLRNPTVTVLTATWSTGSLGLAGPAYLSSVREVVRDQIDKFINAYLAANPKR